MTCGHVQSTMHARSVVAKPKPEEFWTSDVRSFENHVNVLALDQKGSLGLHLPGFTNIVLVNEMEGKSTAVLKKQFIARSARYGNMSGTKVTTIRVFNPQRLEDAQTIRADMTGLAAKQQTAVDDADGFRATKKSGDGDGDSDEGDGEEDESMLQVTSTRMMAVVLSDSEDEANCDVSPTCSPHLPDRHPPNLHLRMVPTDKSSNSVSTSDSEKAQVLSMLEPAGQRKLSASRVPLATSKIARRFGSTQRFLGGKHEMELSSAASNAAAAAIPKLSVGKGASTAAFASFVNGTKHNQEEPQLPPVGAGPSSPGDSASRRKAKKQKASPAEDGAISSNASTSFENSSVADNVGSGSSGDPIAVKEESDDEGPCKRKAPDDLNSRPQKRPKGEVDNDREGEVATFLRTCQGMWEKNAVKIAKCWLADSIDVAVVEDMLSLEDPDDFDALQAIGITVANKSKIRLGRRLEEEFGKGKVGWVASSSK